MKRSKPRLSARWRWWSQRTFSAPSLLYRRIFNRVICKALHLSIYKKRELATKLLQRRREVLASHRATSVSTVHPGPQNMKWTKSDNFLWRSNMKSNPAGPKSGDYLFLTKLLLYSDSVEMKNKHR